VRRSASITAGSQWLAVRICPNRSNTWSAVKKELKAKGITLLSAGLDEVPGVYKDIDTVMAAQTDLVEVMGRFEPKLVKMCPAGERPED